MPRTPSWPTSSIAPWPCSTPACRAGASNGSSRHLKPSRPPLGGRFFYSQGVGWCRRVPRTVRINSLICSLIEQVNVSGFAVTFFSNLTIPHILILLDLWGIYPTSLIFYNLWGTVYTRESRSMVIEQVWEESRDYYLDYQKRLIGELLISPVGSIKRRKSWGGWFLYLHKRKGQGFEDVYLGGESDPSVKKIAEKIKNRQRLIRELRSAKNALKLLKANKMSRALKDFTGPLRKLLAAMERLGFFEAGIELIGSYCFKVYQSHFGVEWFPLRTIDIDFAVPIPYKGPPADLEAVLKELGFRQEFCTDGTIYFEGNGLKKISTNPREKGGLEGLHFHGKEFMANAIYPTRRFCIVVG